MIFKWVLFDDFHSMFLQDLKDVRYIVSYSSGAIFNTFLKMIKNLISHIIHPFYLIITKNYCFNSFKGMYIHIYCKKDDSTLTTAQPQVMGDVFKLTLGGNLLSSLLDNAERF